jgi:hypothetical protein
MSHSLLQGNADSKRTYHQHTPFSAQRSTCTVQWVEHPGWSLSWHLSQTYQRAPEHSAARLHSQQMPCRFCCPAPETGHSAGFRHRAKTENGERERERERERSGLRTSLSGVQPPTMLIHHPHPAPPWLPGSGSCLGHRQGKLPHPLW